MIVLADHDVRGAVEAIRRSLSGDEWSQVIAFLNLQFTTFESFGLARDAADREVYRVCQDAGALLVTADRTKKDGPESLESVLEAETGRSCRPVLTLSDPNRVCRDRSFAIRCSVKLINVCMDIDPRRGERRIYVP